MALTVRRRGENGLSAWPGYVDALSTLLMVIIFVLLVFVLAQAFLSVVLSGRDKQLDRVNRQLAEVSEMLSLERGRGADMQQSIAQLSRQLEAVNTARDTLSQQLDTLRAQAERATTDRDALRSERDRLAQQLTDAGLQARANTERVQQLQQDLAASASRTDAAKQETAAVATQLADARRQLGDTNARLASAQAQLAEMQRQIAELDKTVEVGKDTIAAKLSDLAKLAEENRALAALRDSLEKQAQDAAARTVTEQQRLAAVETLLAEEKRLGNSARARLALLSQQVDELKAQLTGVAQALELAQTQGKEKDAQIANLSQKLNIALAAKVEELQRYRSEFFGKLRDVLANKPGVQVVGDRFVFQSEVLFPLGSADLTQAGQNEITSLAITIKDIANDIPSGIKWILRVDGHTDRQPIKEGGRFASNWELSTARAITVVKLLIADGVPPEHLAATGFADHQPLESTDTPDAYAKNRRIELRLTDR